MIIDKKYYFHLVSVNNSVHRQSQYWLSSFFILLWGGTTMQPKLDQQVLQVWKSDERLNQFLKIVGRHLLKYLLIKRQFSRVILSGNFRMLSSLNKVLQNTYDNLRTKFSKHIIDIPKRHIPRRMTSPRFSQPWITCECRRKIKKKESIQQIQNNKTGLWLVKIPRSS